MALFKKRKITLSISVLTLLVFTAILLTPNSISKYKKDKSGSGNIEIAKFLFQLNNSSNLTQSINLNNTITTNNYCDNYVAPGTTGDIQLVLDFTNVDVSTDYTITLGIYDLPSNLRLYSDSAFTNEFISANGTFLINGATTITEHIYWRWAYGTDSTSDTNDNLYMNHNLSIPVIITVSQKIGGSN